MPRLRHLFLLALLPGCAAWSPSLSDAGVAAKTIACTVCQATSGPSDQAAAYAEALRQLVEALAPLAAQRGDAEDVRAILRRLEAAQAQQRQDFEELLDIATTPK